MMVLRVAFFILVFQFAVYSFELPETQNAKLKTFLPDTVIASFKTNAIAITTDHLNNIYLVTRDNTIEKLDMTGNVLRTFSDKRYGTPVLDASNPMKLVAFYDDYDVVIILDNTLSLIASINLQRPDQLDPISVVGASGNALWLYDRDAFRIKRIDETGAVTMSGDDLSLSGVIGHPVAVIERGGRVYLSDSSQGIHVFDTYLNYEKTIPVQGVKYVEVIGQRLYYRVGSVLYDTDVRLFETTSITLPAEVRQVSIQKDRLFLLYDTHVEVRAL